jgi:hypothetical protein
VAFAITESKVVVILGIPEMESLNCGFNHLWKRILPEEKDSLIFYGFHYREDLNRAWNLNQIRTEILANFDILSALLKGITLPSYILKKN